MSSSASSTAGTPEEQPVNDPVLTAIDPELSAPENATDEVETEAPIEAPTRVYLHPEQLAMIQTPEALPIPVLQRSVLRVSYVPAIMPGKWFNRWHERYGDRVQLAEVPVREARGLDSLHQDLCLIDPAGNPAAGFATESTEEGTAASEASALSEAPAEATEHAPIERTTIEHKDVPENPFAHMSIVRPDREPASTDGEKYHSIRLYEELPVVILPVDHVLTVLDEVPVEELAEEFLLQPASDIPAYEEVSRPWRESAGRIVPEGLTDRKPSSWLPPVWACTLCPCPSRVSTTARTSPTAPLRAWTPTRCTWSGRVPPRASRAAKSSKPSCRTSSALCAAAPQPATAVAKPDRHAPNASPPKKPRKKRRHEPPTPAVKPAIKSAPTPRKTATHASTLDSPLKPPAHAAARNDKER
nr:hypothetical protein [uncultured Rothia sp.]